MFGPHRDNDLTAMFRQRTGRRDVVVEARKVDTFSEDYSGKDEFEYCVFIESGILKKTRTDVHRFRTPAGGVAFVSGEGQEQLDRDLAYCIELLMAGRGK